MQPGDNIGFKAGVAQQLLLRSFSKFERQAALVAAKQADSKAAKAPPPPAVKAPAPAAAKAPKVGGTAAKASNDEAADKSATQDTAAKQTTPPAPPDLPPPPPDKGTLAVNAAGAKSSSHLAEQVAVPYNGGHTESYSWEQTLGDVTIHAPVPAGTRAKDVICTIGKSHLMLKLRGASAPIIDADYPCDARNGNEVWEKVKTVDCYWNLAESKGVLCVCVYLEKVPTAIV